MTAPPAPSSPISPNETPVPDSAAPMRVQRDDTIATLDTARWDRLVPRDAPHLRSGFLRALEVSGQCPRPAYLQLLQGDDLIGVAFFYHLPLDLLTLAPRKYTEGFNKFRRRWAPNLLHLGCLTCGPIVTNCRSNVFLSPALGEDARREAARCIVQAARDIPGAPALTLFFEFNDAETATFAPAFAAEGYIQGPSLPGTRLDVRWRTLDEYVGLMRKAFRRTVVKDRALGVNIEFAIVDDWSALADEAWALYRNVVDKADNVLAVLTRDFFRELSRVEDSRLVVARQRDTGVLVGIELMLRGETVLQDVFTGLDYAHNADQRLYFNLLYPVIEYAGQEGFQQISLGQTSYTFKARLGVTVYPLTLFARHRNPVVQRILHLFRPVLLTETQSVTYKVFRDG